MTVAVELAGLEIFGRHGVLEEERREGQRFLFDVRLEVPAGAAASDRLEDAVDYRDVVAVVKEVSDARAYTLLEGLAGAVADALLARFPAERVRIRIRKPEVRLTAPVEYAAVSVERARS